MSRTVALVGADPPLGPNILTQLALAPHIRAISLITTNDVSDEATAAAYNSKIKFCTVSSFEDVDAMALFLLNHDGVVMALCGRGIDAHIAVIDAAMLAGVPRLIPSCLGLDYRDLLVRTVPNLRATVAMVDYLMKMADEAKITFTIMNYGMLVEWFLEDGVMLGLGGGPTSVLDGGDILISVASQWDVSSAICRVFELDHTDERVQNQFLVVTSRITSQTEILSLARQCAPDREWQQVAVSTTQLEMESLDAWTRGERDEKDTLGLILRCVVGHGRGFFAKNDNELLGIQPWDINRMWQAVQEAVAK